MNRILVGGALIGLLGSIALTQGIDAQLSAPIIYVAEAKEIELKPLTVDKMIDVAAHEHGVDPEVMRAVIECESLGSTTIQSYHRRPDGSREQSFGLAQIHLPDHPHITRDQAIDPAFAVDFMAKEMAAGNSWKWTCWRNLYD